jgi:hypothetical protein
LVDHDTLAGLCDNAKIMGDEQDRGAEPSFQVAQKRQNLRLDGDVERGGRLVGDEQPGIARQRHGDHDALAHAT